MNTASRIFTTQENNYDDRGDNYITEGRGLKKIDVQDNISGLISYQYSLKYRDQGLTQKVNESNPNRRPMKSADKVGNRYNYNTEPY